MQDAVGVTGFHPPDEVATLDQALVSLVDRVHVDAVVQGGADDGAHGRVHPRGVASAGENPDTGRRGPGLRHDADLVVADQGRVDLGISGASGCPKV